jgi:hypothetical protein
MRKTVIIGDQRPDYELVLSSGSGLKCDYKI